MGNFAVATWPLNSMPEYEAESTSNVTGTIR